MLRRIQDLSIPIVIAVTFFLVGFFCVCNVVTLSDREIVLGLVAGAIGGLSVLGAVLWSAPQDKLQPKASG